MAPRRRNASRPTAGQFVPKIVKVELSLKDKKACMLCNRKEISEKLYGKLYQLDDVVVHHYCILFSTRVAQNGEDSEGILGFLLKDIKAELTRGSKVICFYCEKKGASILCCGGRCQKMFHLPCGLRNGSMHQYFDTFKSFCEKHRITQTVELSELQKSTPIQCAICKDAVIRSSSQSSIWAPCCKRDAWFHRECMQDLALNAGYFFKCPLCNDKQKFKRMMLTLGIFIPTRDATWETEPNAFAEFSERSIICSVNTCLCTHEDTRRFQNSSGSWKILLCNGCGANGTHQLCSSIIGEVEEWLCEICEGVIDEDVVKKKKIKLELINDGNCSGSSGMSEEQVSSHNKEVSQKLHGEIVVDENRPQSSDNRDVLGLDSDEGNCNVQCLTDIEGPNMHVTEQPNTHVTEQPNTHGTEQPNTHVQVDQTPRMQLPVISSNGSFIPGFIRNLFSNGFSFFSNNSTSADLTSNDDNN